MFHSWYVGSRITSIAQSTMMPTLRHHRSLGLSRLHKEKPPGYRNNDQYRQPLQIERCTYGSAPARLAYRDATKAAVAHIATGKLTATAHCRLQPALVNLWLDLPSITVA